jgi:hypothetical protein
MKAFQTFFDESGNPHADHLFGILQVPADSADALALCETQNHAGTVRQSAGNAGAAYQVFKLGPLCG